MEKLRALETAHKKASEQDYLMESGRASRLLCESIRGLPDLAHLSLAMGPSPDQLWPSSHFKYDKPLSSSDDEDF